ncbi:phospholipase A2 [Catellatospora vulcania]|uniref:phospholipase A2 n=1 Tax=Catellatospora vulcania TaxID=1460450 RepID=UPI0012D41B51|nr:phospholipase A2 [Catellatospora vulcania]
MRIKRRYRRGRGVHWTLAAAVMLAATGLNIPAASAVEPTVADTLKSAFNTYGDTSGKWAGGDGTVSVPLPDGRIAWLFADTFVGAVNADHSLSSTATMVNNAIVVQDGTQLTTLTGGTPQAPASVVATGVADEFYWVGDAVVDGSDLKVIYNRFRRTGTGTLDFAFLNSALATFSLPSLSLTGVDALPFGDRVAWGSTLLNDGGYTYVYGTETPRLGGLKFAHVARVPVGGLDGIWQFWNGTSWTSDSASSVRLLSGIGTSFGIQVVDGQYVLVTAESNIAFNSQVVAYTAASPTGPFSGPVDLFTAPEPAAGNGKPINIYNAQLHPEQAAEGKLLVSYDVNSLDPADVRADIRIYRPRFAEVTWPLPVPDPASLPLAPTALVATPDSSGIVRLTWQAPAGLTFNVYQRDVTSGQTHFVRASTVSQNSVDVGFLRTERTYEFRVTAVNASGEGPVSNVADAVIVIGPPAAPTGVTAVADTTGKITVSWNAVPYAWNYDVYRRDVTAGDTEPSVINGGLAQGTTFTTNDWQQHQHVYEFTVVAKHGGGESPKSASTTATAFYAPPAVVTGLTATPNADGTIALAWTAPAADLWYNIYQRDVTAGESGFNKLPLPVTSGSSTTAGFLAHDHQYEFKVAATNAGGEGPLSTVTAATARYPAPVAPAGVTATVGDGQVQLTWTSADPNAWFNIYQRDVTAGESGFTKLPLPVTSCCTFSGSTLSNGHTYEWKVTATNAAGESAASNVVSGVPQAPLPGTVSGLAVVSNGDGSITLSWTPPAGAQGAFNVYQRAVTAGETSFTKLGLPVTVCCSTTMGLGFLTHNHVYEYKMAAVNGAGEGPLSAVASVTVRYNPPVAPANLRGKTAGDGTITLDWDGPSGASFWIYQRDVTIAQSWQKLPFPVMSCCTMTAGFLAHGHVYEFKVVPENYGGLGPASNTIQVTAYGGLPQPPSNLTATTGDRQVTLRWSASPTSNVQYWIYQRDVTISQSWQKLATPITSCCTFNGALLTNGHNYEWKITASNAAGDSAASNIVSGKPMPPLPQPPSGLTATTGDGRVTLQWTASPSPNVQYWVYQRDVTVGQSWQKLPLPVISCCTFNGGLLTNGHTYEWKLAANNMSGDSGFSNTVSGKPMPPLPQAPSGLTATVGDGKVTLKWTSSPTSSVEYWVYQRDATTGQSWQKLPISVGCCTFNGGILINGHTYEWKIAAGNLSGSSYSNTVSGKPMPPVPKAPTNLTASTGLADDIRDSWLLLEWTPSTTKDVWYTVYYKDVTTAVQYPWKELWVTKPNYLTTTALFGGHTYDFKVSAQNITAETDSAVVRKTVMRSSLDEYERFTQPSTTSYYAWLEEKQDKDGDQQNSSQLGDPYGFDWSDNKCSSPITSFFEHIFVMACVRHDFGYRNHAAVTFNSRVWIDGVMEYDGLRKCDEYTGYFWPYDREGCREHVITYVNMVRLFGSAHW